MCKQFNNRCARFFGVQPKTVFTALVFTAALAAGFAMEGQTQGCFVRGDFNNDGVADAADAGDLTSFIFTGLPIPPCVDAADINDDGLLTAADAALFTAYVGGGAPPLPPFPLCGLDLTPDGFGCLLFRGDMTFDGLGTPPDVVLILLCAFLGDCSCFCCADTNCDGVITGVDVVLELNSVFLGVPLPPCPCPSI